jgi:holo-[acyl-carrier protein] synthase
VIIGIGTDLAEVARIRRSAEQYGDRFLRRIYTERERNYALTKANWAERLAARFAAKEAGMKAIGTGWNRGVGWQDLEIVNEPSGRPTLSLHGAAERIAGELGVVRISLSMTHTKDTAMALVILEGTGL